MLYLSQIYAQSYSSVEEFSFLCRQNSRNFTLPTSPGMTHFEYLRHNGDSANYLPADIFNESLDATISRQIHQLASQKKQEHLSGLIECYRKVCKVC